MEGKKFDEGKPRMELLPWESVREVAKVFTFGAEKYGDHNYKEGMKWSRIYGGIIRHVGSFISGESLDPETGNSHITHAACGCLMLLYYIITNKGEDDRYTRDKSTEFKGELDTTKIIRRDI